MRTRRWTIAVFLLGLFVSFWLGAPTKAGSAATSKIEVRNLELGYVLGRSGVKVRLTLQTGEAVEYRTEEAAETEVLLRIADMFLSGHARMFAETDGSIVRAVSISSVSPRVAQ